MVDLQIYENGEYKNIHLKTRIDKKTGDVMQGLKVDESIEVQKNFKEGREISMGTYSFFSCGAKYLDEDVSFTLSEKEHEAYKGVGDEGDIVKITIKQESYTFKGEKKLKLTPVFELI